MDNVNQFIPESQKPTALSENVPVQTAAPKKPPPSVADITTAIFNKFRSTFLTGPTAASMLEVENDPGLLAALQAFIKNNGGAQLLATRAFVLQQDPELSAQYGNYEFAYLDSCVKGVNCIPDTLHYRLGQTEKGGCFNYDNCSSTEYTGYESCYNPEATGNCNSFTYGAQFLDQDISKIVCVQLGVRAPNHQTGPQNSSFVCYKLRLDANGQQSYTIPESDVPYVAGPSASACPSWSTISTDYNGTLCTPTQSQTTTPTTAPPTTTSIVANNSNTKLITNKYDQYKQSNENTSKAMGASPNHLCSSNIKRLAR